MGFQPPAFTALHTCQTSLQILGGKKARVQAQMQTNNVLAGPPLVVVPATLILKKCAQNLALACYFSSFFSAHFINWEVTSERKSRFLGSHTD